MSLVFLHKTGTMVSGSSSDNNLIGFSKNNERTLFKDILERLEVLYFNEDIIVNERSCNIKFKGDRIINEINNYIDDEKHKIKENETILLEVFSVDSYLHGKKRKISIVMTEISTKKVVSLKKQCKAFKDYLTDNIFKYIEYTEI